MRRLMEKWGTALAVAACVAAITFAAVYTRQDDLRRMAAQQARAAQDQSLSEAQAQSFWTRPVQAPPSQRYIGAYREEGSGLWKTDTRVHYQAYSGQSIAAMCDGTVLEVLEDGIVYQHERGEIITCTGLGSVCVQAGEQLRGGQTIGLAGQAGSICVTVCLNGAYLDPEGLIASDI